MNSSMLTNSVHSRSTGDGEHIAIGLEHLGLLFHLILRANLTSFGSKFKFQEHSNLLGIDLTYLGSKFMAQAPQDSFGFDLTYSGLNFMFNENLHLLYF